MGWLSRMLRRRDRVPSRQRARVPANSWGMSQFTGGKAYGAYYSTDPRRKATDIRGTGGTANDTIGCDVHLLARQLRYLERNNSTVRALVEGHKADIVGTGISIIPDTGDDRLNQELQAAWGEQRETIGVNGESDVQISRMWVGEVDLTGNILCRYITVADRLDRGLIPIAAMPIPLEWLSKEPVGDVADSNSFVAGIEYDRIARPVAYHIANPHGGDGERVPADQIQHAYEIRQPMQSLGEPRLAPVIERAHQRGELIDVELTAASRANTWSSYLKSDAPIEALDDDKDVDGDGDDAYITEFPLGAHANLAPGDDLAIVKSELPNLDVAEFAAAINGDLAAAGQSARVWLDRDGSQYNFANSRFDQIRSNMVTKPFQKWFGREAVGRLYVEAAPYLMAMIGRPWPRDPEAQRRLSRFRVQPDVPPETDERAAAETLATLLENDGITLEEWHGSRGRDWRQVIDQRAAERAYVQQVMPQEDNPQAEGAET